MPFHVKLFTDLSPPLSGSLFAISLRRLADKPSARDFPCGAKRRITDRRRDKSRDHVGPRQTRTRNDDHVRSAVTPRCCGSSASIHLLSTFANCRLTISNFRQTSKIIFPEFRRQRRNGESDASDFTSDVSVKVARRAMDAPRRGSPRTSVPHSSPVATSVFARDWSRLRDPGDHGLHFGAEAALARRPHCILRPYAFGTIDVA